MKVSIVVVTWRSRELLRRCLHSLRRHAPGCETIVVDNASADSTDRMVRKRFPAVKLLVRSENEGYAAGCNLGTAQGDGDAVLFLNPDAEATPGAVTSLAAALRQTPSAAAIGGLLTDRSGRPQRRYAPRPFPSLADLARAAIAPGGLRGRVPAGHLPVQVDQVAGACIMVRRGALDDIGGLDEGFWPVFFEDVDLCLRLHQRGGAILHHPSARFVHRGGGSVQRMDAASFYAAWYRNLQRYSLKHHGEGAGRLLRALTVPGAGLRLAGTVFPGGGGAYGRGARAAAYLHVASRSLAGWPNASRSMS